MRKALIVLAVLIGTVFSQDVGKVEKYKGRVDLLKRNSIRAVSLERVEPLLSVGDILRTKSNGYALVSFVDGSRAELFELTRLKVVEYREVRELNVQKGIVKFEIESLKGVKGFRIRTPHAVIGVKGTTFWVFVFPGFTRVIVEEGRVQEVYRFSVKKESWSEETQTTSEVKDEPFSEKPPADRRSFMEVELR